MSAYSIDPLVLVGVETYPLASRKSKVHVRDFGAPPRNNPSVAALIDSLPGFLAAQDFRDLLAAIRRARSQRRAILWGLGGHVIKVGLGPVLIDLMRRGFVSGIAMNGAALIHDFEIALAGHTSEDVEAALGDGKFGMSEETGTYVNEIAKLAARIRIGYGEAKHLHRERLRKRDRYSCASRGLGIGRNNDRRTWLRHRCDLSEYE